MVFTLLVISSPTTPFPLVDAVISFPFLYCKLTDRPSIFNSHTYCGEYPSFWILFSKFMISSSLNTSSIDNIGMVWFTLSNPFKTVPPTLLVGLSSFFKSGYSISNSINSLKYLSNSWSVRVGLSKI